MKDNGKKTNKQNTARSSQNTARKLSRKTKDERREILFSKKHMKTEHRRAVYGTDHGATYALARGTDLNRRFVAAFLTLVFTISCLVAGFSFIGRADANTANLTPGKVSNTESGMVLNKYLTPNADGDYNLTLEAYSTADMKTVTEKVPTDFVIVVDQSGSMDTSDMPTGIPTVQNNKYLEDIANGAYFYKDGDNYYRVYGVKDYLYRYYPANYWFTGDIVEHLGTDIGWFMRETDATYDIDNAFYFREVVGDQTYYIPIKTTIEGKIGTYYMKFSYPSKITGNTYTFSRTLTTYSSNGKSPWYKNVLNGDVMTSGALWRAANAAVQTLYPSDDAYTYSTLDLIVAKPRTGMYINYPMYGRHLSYTKLCYRDVDGVEHTLPSNQSGQEVWEYCDDNGIARTTDSVTSARPTYSGLYTFPTNTDRISALKAALTEFAQAVANEQDTFGAVDNRVSIVGFSSSGYNNTELLTHTERDISSGSTNGWQKSTCDNNASEYYGKGLVGSTNGNVGTVNPKITRAITAITANGGTQPEDGLNMAYKVLTNRGSGEGKTTYKLRSGPNKGQEVDRNTIVIFFTDGRPGDYHESNQYSEANEVVAQAKYIKDYGSSLFSIGVFGESDGNPLTYYDRTATRESDTKAWKYLGGWMETYRDGGTYYCLRRQWRPGGDGYTADANDTIFDYMSVVSSNYPDAQNYIAPAWLDGNFSGNYIAATDGDTVRKKSTAESTNKYYRMASNQATLVEAFLQAVSIDNQETSTEIKMDATAVLKDVIDTTAFVLPDNPTATVRTAQYTLNSDTDTIEDNRWGTATDSSLSAVWNGNQVTVTGFDYSTNYIAWGKPATGGLPPNTGRKLIVTIPGVKPVQNVTTSGTKTLYSNTSDASVTSGDGETSVAFLRPSITRHSYTLNVTGDNESDATFNVVPSLTGGSSSTADVILVTPYGRMKYSEYVANESPAFSMSNNDTFYFENVPSDYQVNTSITATGNNYIYTWTDNSNETLDQTTAKAKNYDYLDSTIYISSVANTRSVTIRETVDGSFANDTDKFTPTLYLVPPEGQQVPAEGATYSGINWEKDGTNNRLKYTTRAIQGNNNDSVSLTVPANWKLVVEQTDSDNYDVTDKEYVLGTSGTSTDIPAGGVDITDNLTITITNTRDNIPITGVDDHDTYNWVIYLLVAIAGIAVVGTGIFLWKKKDEFVEE